MIKKTLTWPKQPAEEGSNAGTALGIIGITDEQAEIENALVAKVGRAMVEALNERTIDLSDHTCENYPMLSEGARALLLCRLVSANVIGFMLGLLAKARGADCETNIDIAEFLTYADDVLADGDLLMIKILLDTEAKAAEVNNPLQEMLKRMETLDQMNKKEESEDK